METVLYAPIYQNRRIALAGQLAFQYMTMASLIAWRTTCRDNFLSGTMEFRQSQLHLVARFFPNPPGLLQYITRWGALIVGEAALSLILHDPSLCDTTFELAVGNLVYEPFIRCLTHFIPFGTHLSSRTDGPAPPTFPSIRHVSRIAEFTLKSGLVIQVYESASPSPCDVVSGSWTTALMNFATEFSFGCAYPRLTLNYRGVLCDGRVGSIRSFDQTTHDHLKSKGMEFTHYSPDWSGYSAGPYNNTPSASTTTGCGRTLYVCPSQGRFFGDPGSLVIFLHGFFVDFNGLRKRSVAPYGLMSAWRIPSKQTCEGRCVEDLSVLPPYVVTILVRFQDHLLPPLLHQHASLTASPVADIDNHRTFYRRHSI